MTTFFHMKKPKVVPNFILAMALMTLCLVVCKYYFIHEFQILTEIPRPNFGHLDQFQAYYDIIFSSAQDVVKMQFYYYSYFITDLLSFALIIYLVYWIIMKNFEWKYDRLIWIGLAALLYLAHAGLDIFYLFGVPVFSMGVIEITASVFSSLKFVLLLLLIAWTVYALYRKYELQSLEIVWKFLKASIFSIIIVLMLSVLITFIPQGLSIIVALYYSPLNFLFAFYLINLMALTLSHYPVYLISESETGDTKEWYLAQIGFKTPKYFGIAYYELKQNKTPNTDDAEMDRSKTHPRDDKKWIQTLIRGWGAVTYMMWIYIFLFVFKSFMMPSLPAAFMALFCGVFFLVLYNYFEDNLEYFKTKEKLFLATNLFQPLEPQLCRELYNEAKCIVKTYVIALAFFLIVMAVLICVGACLEWTRWTQFLTILAVFSNYFLYVYFRLSRSVFQYVFNPFHSRIFQKYNIGRTPKRTEEVRRLREYHQCLDRCPKWYHFDGILKYLGLFSDDVFYLHAISRGVWVVGIFLVLINFNTNLTILANPLNILLSYLILLYAIFAILIKHWQFHLWNKEKGCGHGKSASISFYRHFPVAMVLLIGLMIVLKYMGVNIDQFKLVEEKGVQLSLKDMSHDRHYQLTSVDSCQDASMDRGNDFYIASFGGGLKANLWNLLVLDTLDRHTGGKFMSSTISMSGASGGSMGLANFLSLRHYIAPENRKKAILDIGHFPHLSIDMAFTFGRDWILRRIPFAESLRGKNRSYFAMREYAEMTGMPIDTFKSKSFRDTWQEFEKKSPGLPILIINTTSTRTLPGYASSVILTDTGSTDSPFLGSLDILEFTSIDSKRNSLTYYDATSTSNRFPLFSPSASIEGKGQFIDGGYYDNSGLLSTMGLSTMKDKTLKTDRRKVYIQILNGKSNYIREFISTNRVKIKNIIQTEEWSAIANSITDTEKIPYALQQLISLRQGSGVDTLIKIFLPHKISLNDIEEAIGGEVVITNELLSAIRTNNIEIKKALGLMNGYQSNEWGIVEPPLARLLSVPAIKYEEAMVKYHPEVQGELNCIYSLLNEND